MTSRRRPGTTATSSNTPVGLKLNRKYKIGRQLGQGAQASVHAIVDTTTTNKEEIADWVIKLAVLPSTLALPKKKKSLQEINADMLNGEYVTYQAMKEFAQGTIIPRLPLFGNDIHNDIPVKGEITTSTNCLCVRRYFAAAAVAGCYARWISHHKNPILVQLTIGTPQYRFLVLEKMDGPFVEIVDELVSASNIRSHCYYTTTKSPYKSTGSATGGLPPTTSINLGPIALKMIGMMETFHSRGYVIVDVKTDNLMLCDPNNTSVIAPSTTAKASKGKKRPTTNKGDDAVIDSTWLADRIRLVDLALVKKFRDYATGKHVPNVGNPNHPGTPLYSSLHVHDGQSYSRRDDMVAIILVVCELIVRLHAALSHTQDQYEPACQQQQFPSYLPWANESSLDAVARVKRDNVMNRHSTLFQQMPTPEIATHMYEWLQQAHNLSYTATPPYDAWKQIVSSLSIPIPSSAATRAAKTPSSSRTVKAAATTTHAATKKKSPPPQATTAVATSTTPAQSRRAKAAAALATAAIASAAATAVLSVPDAHDTTRRSCNRRVATTTKRGHASDEEDDDEEEEWDAKPAAKKRAAATHPYDDPNQDVIMLLDSDEENGSGDEESFCTAQSSPNLDDDDDVVPMEIDMTIDGDDTDSSEGNAKGGDVAAQAKRIVKNAKGTKGFHLTITEGPSKGKSFSLIQGHSDVLVLGSHPTPNSRKKSALVHAIPDPSLDKNHAQFSFVITKRSGCILQVKDLGSNDGVYVNSQRVPNNGSAPALMGAQIRLGSTLLTISSLQGESNMEKENTNR